jgi:hypothetical protein
MWFIAEISNAVNKNNGICFNIDLPLKIICVIIYDIIIRWLVSSGTHFKGIRLCNEKQDNNEKS